MVAGRSYTLRRRTEEFYTLEEVSIAGLEVGWLWMVVGGGDGDFRSVSCELGWRWRLDGDGGLLPVFVSSASGEDFAGICRWRLDRDGRRYVFRFSDL
nr:hypothetical protein Iba_chr11cCG4500 [Ipomoea batatas]GMD58478.1 hypothetical protein Iba_chr11fCG5930 [Ipomoea batatas]